MARRTYPTELYLCTTILRAGNDNDGEPVEIDAIVYFDARMTARGGKATWTDPGWAPEFECTFTEAAIDSSVPEAPLTEIEVETLRRIFDERHAEACEIANDNFCGE